MSSETPQKKTHSTPECDEHKTKTERPKIKFCLHSDDAVVPTFGTDRSAGYDLSVVKLEEIRDNNVYVFNTDISVETPPGYHTELFPRSSISKTHWTMANSVGVIDEDYRGCMLIALRWNGGSSSNYIKLPEFPWRIGQLVLRKTEKMPIEIVKQLSDTKRGTGGFGSTGS